jgi:urease accessory protein
LLLPLLQLIHLADSALPIGSASHTFGLETLVAEGGLTVEILEEFLTDHLIEVGQVEAIFCRAGYDRMDLPALNARFNAMRPARESRDASLKLGRRFLRLAANLMPVSETESHFCIAFGLVAGALTLDPDLVCAAYLHQSIFSQLSVCQRLLPLGQTRATEILWCLKRSILKAVEASKSVSVEDFWSCLPALEIGSMRHPRLATRLFIS